MLIEFEGIAGPMALDPDAIREVYPNGKSPGWSVVTIQGGNEYDIKGTPSQIREIVNNAILAQKTARAKARST